MGSFGFFFSKEIFRVGIGRVRKRLGGDRLESIEGREIWGGYMVWVVVIKL